MEVKCLDLRDGIIGLADGKDRIIYYENGRFDLPLEETYITKDGYNLVLHYPHGGTEKTTALEGNGINYTFEEIALNLDSK